MHLTAKQHVTYIFLKKYIENHGIAPTEAEIAKGIGITSRGVVHRYIQALQQAGLLEIIPYRKRNIKLIEQHQDKLSLPIVGKIAAGSPIEALPNYGVINISDKLLGNNRFILEVKGDSMIGDNICDGDYIICEACKDISKNDIAVVLVDSAEVTLKRCQKNNDKTITLVPSNPQITPEKVGEDRVQIQGRYIGLLRLN